MRKLTFVAGTLFVAIAASIAAPGCKPSSQKQNVGPFNADRYEAAAPDGSKLDCYVFGAESNKPARLCGDPSPIPNFAGVLFHAAAPSPTSRFVESIGEALGPGYYLLKAIGTDSVDCWPLGQLSMHEWLGDGKKLLTVDTSADHHTKVRIIDPAARADQSIDAGKTKADSFLLIRAPGDAAILLLARLGGDEMISVADPVNSADLSVADASDEKSAGNRKLFHKGDLDRQNGGIFKPTNAMTTLFQWTKGAWTFDGSPLGPFTVPAVTR